MLTMWENDEDNLFYVAFTVLFFSFSVLRKYLCEKKIKIQHFRFTVIPAFKEKEEQVKHGKGLERNTQGFYQ